MMNIAKGYQSEHVALNTYFKEQQHSDIEKVALNQWRCLDGLVETYKNRVLTKLKHGTLFFDDKWEGTVAAILWSKHETVQNFPLILLCRIVAFSEIEIQDNRSFVNSVTSILNNHDFLRTSRVLHARRGEAMVPMSFQETSDIENFIVSTGLKAGHLAKFITKLRYLPPEYTQNASFLRLECDLPWSEINRYPGKELEMLYMQSLTGGTKIIKSYQPIATVHVDKIVKFAIPLINEHADDLNEIFQTATKYQSADLKDGRRGDTIAAKGRDIILKHRKWLADEFDYNYTDANNNGGSMYFKWVNDLYYIVQASCLWIVTLTTALRNFDVRHLQYNCYVKATNSDELFYLITNIKKTNIEDFVIPVCQNTVNAIQLLQNMSQVPEDKTNFLVRYYIHREKWNKRGGNIKSGETLNAVMRKLCAHLDIDIKEYVEKDENDEGLAHRIRYTMSEFVGTHSPIAVLLLQRLLGHKSSAMTNMYLSKIKAVQEAREKVERESRINLSNSLAKAIVNKKVAGKAGKRLSIGAEHMKSEIKMANTSMTEGELQMTLVERFSEILQSRIERGSVFALQTPHGVVCMRNTLLTDEAPCATHEASAQRKKSNISRAFTEALGMLPSPENCIGVKCKHALLADSVSEILLEQFDYYTKFLAGLGYTTIDLTVEATNFIKLYRQPLTEVFGKLETYADIKVTNA
jgi:hypothetical protein